MDSSNGLSNGPAILVMRSLTAPQAVHSPRARVPSKQDLRTSKVSIDSNGICVPMTMYFQKLIMWYRGLNCSDMGNLRWGSRNGQNGVRYFEPTRGLEKIAVVHYWRHSLKFKITLSERSGSLSDKFRYYPATLIALFVHYVWILFSVSVYLIIAARGFEIQSWMC